MARVFKLKKENDVKNILLSQVNYIYAILGPGNKYEKAFSMNFWVFVPFCYQ